MNFPRRPGPTALIALGYGLLLLSWAVSNSPGSSPDEPAHLTKALGVASGQFVGRDADYPVTPEFGPAQLLWINSVTRSFEVPRAATFGTIATCNAFRPEQPSTCITSRLRQRASGRDSMERTHTGSYQPAPYLPIGLAARLGGAAPGAVIAGRLVVAAVSLSLIALAAASLWSAAWRRWSALGLTVALSPMVIFLSASLSPSGMEIAGGVAASAGAIAISRSTERRRIAWVALGAGGTVMALSRSTGPVWAAAMLLLVVALSGVRGAVIRLRAGGGLALGALVAMALGSAATFAWDLSFMPAPPRSPQPGRLFEAVAHLPELLRQSIGVFGWLDTAMPALAYTAWRMMLIAVIGLALLVGNLRERLVLLAATAAVLAATIGLTLAAVYPTGFDTQARYTLPIGVAVPLLAGEIVARRRHRVSGLLPERLPLAFAATAAAVHLIGWYANGRRHGVGIDGPLWFIGRGEWSPPIGWAFWAAVASAGVALVAGSSIAYGGTRRGRHTTEHDYPGG
ncbi:MAG TPA: DUF2142 domain-containing protein [Acidimicrobiales bacterium]|nr:DUF2142 domain-containing protein [Acidimicrobiales bacterium]